MVTWRGGTEAGDVRVYGSAVWFDLDANRSTAVLACAAGCVNAVGAVCVSASLLTGWTCNTNEKSSTHICGTETCGMS